MSKFSMSKVKEEPASDKKARAIVPKEELTAEEKAVMNKLMKADRRYIKRRMEAEIENAIDAENAKRHSIFRNFAQLNRYNDIFDTVIDDMVKYPIAIAIFFLFTENMNSYNEITMTRNDIAERFGISVKTVYRAIKFLNEKKYIYTIKDGRDNTYVLSPNIVWAGHGSNIKFCKFPREELLKKDKDKITTKRERTNRVVIANNDENEENETEN